MRPGGEGGEEKGLPFGGEDAWGYFVEREQDRSIQSWSHCCLSIIASDAGADPASHVLHVTQVLTYNGMKCHCQEYGADQAKQRKEALAEMAKQQKEAARLARLQAAAARKAARAQQKREEAAAKQGAKKKEKQKKRKSGWGRLLREKRKQFHWPSDSDDESTPCASDDEEEGGIGPSEGDFGSLEAAAGPSGAAAAGSGSRGVAGGKIGGANAGGRGAADGADGNREAAADEAAGSGSGGEAGTEAGRGRGGRGRGRGAAAAPALKRKRGSAGWHDQEVERLAAEMAAMAGVGRVCSHPLYWACLRLLTEVSEATTASESISPKPQAPMYSPHACTHFMCVTDSLPPTMLPCAHPCTGSRAH